MQCASFVVIAQYFLWFCSYFAMNLAQGIAWIIVFSPLDCECESECLHMHIFFLVYGCHPAYTSVVELKADLLYSFARQIGLGFVNAVERIISLLINLTAQTNHLCFSDWLGFHRFWLLWLLTRRVVFFILWWYKSLKNKYYMIYCW